jgi:acyl-CoA thioester hydrolase
MDWKIDFEGNSWHEHRVRVQYADTDRMDMVYHGTYARFFEAARVEMLRDLGVVYAKMEQEGVLLPVVQLNMMYRKPARYDDLLSVLTNVAVAPTSKLVLNGRIVHQGQVLVEAEVTLVFVYAQSGKPCRAPEAVVTALDEAGLIVG